MNNLRIRYASERYTASQNQAIEMALVRSLAAHAGQLRRSGEPYIIHPVAVAETVAEWGLDHEAVMAALLHDVVEDTSTTLQELAAEFGPKVAELVDGVTKLRLSNGLRPDATSARREASNENLRKLLLATSRDYRVIMIKLADRLHNLRTLGHMPPEKQARIARESLEVFAPLADRLGMGQLKSELEDLGFRYADPAAYAALSQLVDTTTRAAERYLSRLKYEVRAELEAAGVAVGSVEARHKHLYSVHKKLAKTGGDISKIYDLVALRVIVPDVASCYQVLGVLHQHYRPLIYRIKDYIAVPKPNGYQSLHTTVFALEGRITEIQIRTPVMHKEAEHGLAAHFYYDAQKASVGYAQGQASVLPSKLNWVAQLSNLQQSSSSGEEFIDGAKLELFADRLFVFSPKGDLYELPEGATPVDFAFAVHTEVGLRTLGAKVNGRMVPLDVRLENRDVVEVLTRREASPNRDWLGFIQTAQAKNRIRAWFRAASRETNVASGRGLLEAELKTLNQGKAADLTSRIWAEALDTLHLRSADDLYAALGDGSLTLGAALRRLVPQVNRPAAPVPAKRAEPTGRVLIDGQELPYNLAACCRPVFPQPLVGYLTRGAGVTVHSLGCRNLPDDHDRYTTCGWETNLQTPGQLSCHLELTAINRIGLLSVATGIIAAARLHIGQLASRPGERPGESVLSFTVEVADLFALAALIRQLGRVPGVSDVHRVD